MFWRKRMNRKRALDLVLHRVEPESVEQMIEAWQFLINSEAIWTALQVADKASWLLKEGLVTVKKSQGWSFFMSDDRIVMRKIVIEVPQKKKARYVATASRDRMKLMDWIIDTLDDNAWFNDDEVAQNRRDSTLDRHDD